MRADSISFLLQLGRGIDIACRKRDDRKVCLVDMQAYVSAGLACSERSFCEADMEDVGEVGEDGDGAVLSGKIFQTVGERSDEGSGTFCGAGLRIAAAEIGAGEVKTVCEYDFIHFGKPPFRET